MTMRWMWRGLLACLLAGCGQAPPTLVGGKPVRYWVEAAAGNDARARHKAVVKLGNVGPADAAVLPVLLRALEDSDATVRRAAILGLVKYGAEASKAVPTLTRMREEDEDAEVRSYAARAVEKLEGAGGQR
jgi:HEAT repeat protein